MKGSDFRFHSVQFLYCKCRKVNFRRDGSNIESLDTRSKRNNKSKI